MQKIVVSSPAPLTPSKGARPLPRAAKPRVSGILSVVRQLGVRHLLQMRRARTWGWEGLLRGHMLTRVVQTLLAAGVFDALHRDGTIDAAAFASRHGLDARVLRSLCEYLAARRVLRRGSVDGSYVLDEDGAFLVENQLLRGWLELVHGYEEVLYALPDLLAGRRHYGPGDLERGGELVAVGSGRASIGFFFPLTVETIRRAGYKRVLDIGCGDATFLRYMCARLPGVQGVGIDRSPEAVEAARHRIAADNLSDRIQVVCGDAFELGKYGDELSGVDAATSFFVLHELCGGPAGGPLKPFLQTYRRALPGVPLIAIEAIRPTLEEMRRRPGPAVEYTLLHDLSNQTTIARGAWREVLQSAGFAEVDEQHFDFARASIVTAK